MTSVNIGKPLNLRTSNTLKSTRRDFSFNSPYHPFKTLEQTKNSTVSSSARPATNGANSEEYSKDYIGPQGAATIRRAFPLKHWRKQLIPTQNSGRSKISIFDVDRPGGTTIITDKEKKCVCQDEHNNTSIIRTDFKSLNVGPDSQTASNPYTEKVLNNGYIQIGQPEQPGSYKIETGIYDTKYIGCCAENNIIRSARTNVSKAYFSNTKQYLQSRCLTFDQKQTTNTISAEKSKQGIYSTGNCPLNAPPNCVGTTIYNPNNASFGVQGAVSSSTRILQLQVNTINKNAASFKKAWGQEGANAAKYQTSSYVPYFLKNKYTKGLPKCYKKYSQSPTCD